VASDDWVELGRIVGAHGIRGQVRVRYFGDGPDHLLDCEEIWLGSGKNDAHPRRFDVISGGLGRGGEARLGLEGIDDRDVALGLRGSLVLMRASELEVLPRGEFYWHQLIGCRVELEEGPVIGVVREIWDTGAHDTLVVEDESGRQQLLSTARELMPLIDIEGRRIVIRDLPGLVDLATDSTEADSTDSSE
jgi:16S rRNA processing protein RimM